MARPRAQVAVEGGAKLRRELKKAGDDLSELKDVHERIGQIVAVRARGEAPVKTGRLAGTVRAARMAGGAMVRAGTASVRYAGPIHWGWPKRNIEAQPFLSEGAAQTQDQWMSLYEQRIDEVLATIRGDA